MDEVSLIPKLPPDLPPIRGDGIFHALFSISGPFLAEQSEYLCAAGSSGRNQSVPATMTWPFCLNLCVLHNQQLNKQLSFVQRSRTNTLELSDGRSLSYGMLLWDAGIMPNPLLKELDCPRGKRNGIVTDSCFRVHGFPGVWAIGDCAETPDPNDPGKTFAPTAQNGTRAGVHVADNIIHVLRGQRPKPFHYKQIGTLAVVSNRKGVAHVFGLEIKGVIAWLMWRGVYIAKMPGMRKRLGLLRDYISH